MVLKMGYTITEAPAIDQVFDLEKAIVEQFLHAGHEKKDIVFLTTGIGAANTTVWLYQQPLL